MHIDRRVPFCLFGYLVALGNAFAQSSCSGDIQVQSQVDLDQIKSCKQYTGSISIDKASGADLSLLGVTQVNGDINVLNNEGLARLSFPQLEAVNGLKLENNKVLNKLDLPSLAAARSFEVTVHPALPEITFPSGLSQVSKITVSDTTITRLEGLNMDRADEIVIDNNIYLRNLAARNLSEITNSLAISENSPYLTLDVSHLRSLQQGSFRNLASVSLQSLEKVNGDLSFISNKFPSLELSNITVVGGTLTLSNNNQLEKLEVPELRRLGGALSISNNTQLAHIEAFSNLEEIDGSLDLTGSFDEIKLPRLQDVSHTLSNWIKSSNESIE
ncbi:hypothetical protein BJV82DRAFT_511641 [Fennellomyces sp. T-0311]|nr:hypothetical protein BJV82DRAFT_511641 [Fennellomyces sp. T-0311]